MKKIIIVIAFLLGLLAFSSGASAFEVSSSTLEQTVCPAETAIYTISVTNTAASTDSYTVTLSGTSSKWAVAAPSGFSLNSGTMGLVNVYVTPPVNTLEGTYSLKISVSSELAGTEELAASVDVVSCHGATLTAETSHREVCTATLAEYDLTLRNAGKYSEAYDLTMSGNAVNWATLSDDLVGLEAGEEKKIKVFITPPADQAGDFVLTVLAKSLGSDAMASQTLTLKSNSCYDYDLMLDKNYISFCENSEARIPLTIKNSGTANNVFNLKVEGPSWAKVETEKLAVSAESSRETFLVLFPGFEVQGDFKVSVSAEPDLGDAVLKQELTAHVEPCHIVDVKISDSKDTLCAFNSKLYEVSIVNPGKHDKSYALKVFGADWAELDKNFLDLSAGETAKINLNVNPENAPAGRYILKVIAESQDAAHTSDSDTLDIYVASPETCFGVNLLPALTKVEVVAGEGSLVPVIVENKGSETSTYTLDVSGTGANYAQFNPATITLDGGEAETVYMYVSVPEKTPQTQYKITISAKLEDGTISSSSTIDMAVLLAGTKIIPKEKIGMLKSKILSVTNKIKVPFATLASKIKAAAITVKNKITGIGLPEFDLPELSLPNISLPKISLPDFGKEQVEEEQIQITGETTEEITEPEEEETGITQYLSEDAKKLLEEEEESEEIENKTFLPNLGLKNKITGFTSGIKEKTSGLGDRFSGLGGKITDSIGSLKNKITSINLGDLGTKFKSALGKGKIFMLATTYFVPNWVWLIGLIFILAAISYMLKGEDETEKLIKETTPEEPKPEDKPKEIEEKKEEPKPEPKKGAWQRFIDFLEEDEEPKPEEKPVEEPKPEPKEVSAEEILKEADKIIEEKPAAVIKKPVKKVIRKPKKKVVKRKIIRKTKKKKTKLKPKKKKRRRKVLISEERLIKEED